MNFFDALHEKLEFTYNVTLISVYTRNFGFNFIWLSDVTKTMNPVRKGENKIAGTSNDPSTSFYCKLDLIRGRFYVARLKRFNEDRFPRNETARDDAGHIFWIISRSRWEWTSRLLVSFILHRRFYGWREVGALLMLASQAQREDRSTLHSFDLRRKNNSWIFGDGVNNFLKN